jgi:nucleotide-binding universal stress UspA family protein
MSTLSTDPLILCYDGSQDAKHAIARAGEFFSGRRALVVTVWQSPAGANVIGWSATATGMVDFAELERAAVEEAGKIAEDGARIAREAGLEAEPTAVEANGPVWKAIIETADHHQAKMIVVGSRGLTGIRSILLGSVSSAVVHHADQPTLVIHRENGDARAE